MSTTSAAPASATRSYRPDIQGLRALAVGLVVVYHIWPSVLPGGYVGVDVFFVISGYLITGLLARDAQRNGRVHLLEFYGRRARRLMPAAALVLTVTWVVSRAYLPVNQLPAAANQIRASALYFQNIVLADNSVDYLKSERSASPVQHFWSLSVEEQFYLVWPLVFVLAAAGAWVVARRRRDRGRHRAQDDAGTQKVLRAIAFGLGGVAVVASFVYSLHKTAHDPAAAYYVTTTRIWELGLGGVLALLPTRFADRLGRAGVLGWLGAGAILYAAVRYSGATAFPGYAALLPVAGALLMLGCGSPRGAHGPAVVSALRPMVFLGGISYSLYLWHWPVVVLYKAYRGHGIGLAGGLGIVAVSVVLAYLTKRFVEDPVREWRFVQGSSVRSLATVALAGVPVLLAAVWLSGHPTKAAEVDAAHPGAASLVTGTPAPTGTSLIPTLTQAAADLPKGITPTCEAAKVDTDVRTCTLVDPAKPTKTVALVGDSRAGQWSDAIAAVAEQQRWKLVVATKSQCPLTSVQTAIVGQKGPYTSCTQWGKDLMAKLLTSIRPDVVVTSDRPYGAVRPGTTSDAESLTAIGKGMGDDWRTLLDHRIQVVGISETPQQDTDIPTCLASKGGGVVTCSRAAVDALPHTSPVDVAAAAVGGRASVVDLTDLICPGTYCRAIIGNVIVYIDSVHLSRSYTMSLVPYLSTRLLTSKAFTAGG